MSFKNRIDQIKNRIINFIEKQTEGLVDMHGPVFALQSLKAKIAIMFSEIEDRSENYKRATFVFCNLVLMKTFEEKHSGVALAQLREWKEDADQIEKYLDQESFDRYNGLLTPEKFLADTVLEIEMSEEFMKLWNTDLEKHQTIWFDSDVEVPDFESKDETFENIPPEKFTATIGELQVGFCSQSKRYCIFEGCDYIQLPGFDCFVECINFTIENYDKIISREIGTGV